jgi:hypothetical protein
MPETNAADDRSLSMAASLWVKETDNQVLKPLSQWRDDFYGYWMVVTDSATINGEDMAIARYYGTDREKILDIWNELCLKAERPTVAFYHNVKSNWMGGAFLVKVDN